ncbi:MAG: hypothetical protein GY856_54330 [bacterium]|nr:hypothetical protein [bacterium]
MSAQEGAGTARTALRAPLAAPTGRRGRARDRRTPPDVEVRSVPRHRFPGQQPETLIGTGTEQIDRLEAVPPADLRESFLRVHGCEYTNPSKLRDDQVAGELRDCTQPRDAEVLRRLVACGPSKVLITSRLMPRALENRARRPPAGVRRPQMRP